MDTSIHCAIMTDQMGQYHFLFSYQAANLGELLKRATNRTFPLDQRLYQNKKFQFYNGFTIQVWYFQTLSRHLIYTACLDALRHCSEANPAIFTKELWRALEA